MYPIVFTYPARIDHMSQIVFGVSDDKIGVRNWVVTIVGSSVGQRNPRGPLHRFESRFGSGEANKASIEIVEPPAHLHGCVPCGISSNKN